MFETSLNLNSLKLIVSPIGVICLVVLWVVYYILVALYNISPLHPLSQFPGPKLAAASYIYEAYYDWWRVGRFGHQIRRMHETYGPLVRINPDELHCSDPAFADHVYAGSGHVRDRWVHQVNSSGVGPIASSTFSSIPHELHRVRRAAISRFFSRQQVLKYEDEVYQLANETVDRMLRWAGKEPFDVREAFNCFTADVISQYAFGQTLGLIAQDDWKPNFATWIKPFTKCTHMLRFNPLMRMLVTILPQFAEYLGEDFKPFVRQMYVTIPGHIKAALEAPDKGRLFTELIQSKSLSESDKSISRLSGEGFVLFGAGTETTSSVLAIATYRLLSEPTIYAKLMQDLDGIDPSNLKLLELERRPYLWAIIHETLRMMPGVAMRSSRIARDEDLVYTSRVGDTWVIPKGTPVAMSAMINHWNQELFPNPDEFLPERWLIDGEPNKTLQKSLISFSKGTRSCLGENLAYCELYIMLALMAFRVLPRARLHDTTIENIQYDHELIVIQSKKGPISVTLEIS
ncbi:cytochrome P450 [Dactylonectria macrodidyma]|uniref:Cytochrome P450 n=1 Tax=Dactylonectria macrodidyma TaxID=307937 RepID=A0A9P9DX41_9HYPO|nr:cytochrome P450 [Dactylonectria macrodidyma]